MPQRLDAVVGQKSAVDGIIRRIETGRIPHALLLQGPDGVGKRTTAEALAAFLLCRSPEKWNACGRCSSCAQVDAEAHRDLYRVLPNEKGNILVDNVRASEHAVRLRAAEGGRKVVLLCDAHQMGGPAQNALLKTLEEPPENTHLLLTTDRSQALLPTVLSRCQRLDFVPMTTEAVETVLARHEPNQDPESRRLLATLSSGAPGQALTLDFQAIVERRDRAASLDTKIDPSSSRAPLDAIDEAREIAKDRETMAELLDIWVSWARDQVLLAAGLPHTHLSHPDQMPRLEGLAERRGLRQTLDRAQALLEARLQLDLPFNLNATMIAEQLLLTLAGQLPLRRIPLRPSIAPTG